MTSNVMPSVVQIEGKSLKQLVTEIKETLAIDINPQVKDKKNKKFGIVDMWNCHRNMRTAVSMRRY